MAKRITILGRAVNFVGSFFKQQEPGVGEVTASRWKVYDNVSGNSQVRQYQVLTYAGRKGQGDQYGIKVQFADGSTYTYTERTLGPQVIRYMIETADSGFGLNSYITRIIKTRYDAKG